MSELENQFVKRGAWTNWNDGPVMGRTLTVDARTGNFLVAVLTICTSIGTAQLFHLGTFIYHQFRANGRPSDGLFWQQQALLRTLPTPTALVADYFKLWWSWRTRANRALVRSWFAALLVLCFAAAAIAAGISASYIVDTSNLEVLVESPHCALLNLTKMALAGGNSYASVTKAPANTYAQTCYRNDSSPPAICRNIFTEPNVPFSVKPAPCPWNSSICSGADLPAIDMDSGLLEVGKQFGWNLEARHNLWLRKRTTCSVLPYEGYADIINASQITNDLGFGGEAVGLRYGIYENMPAEKLPQYLLQKSLESTNHTQLFSTRGMITRLHPSPWWGSQWRPIPEMNRTDADVTVNFISANVIDYNKPVDDPVFGAHKSRIPSQNSKVTYYRADYPIRAIGCSEQFQFCAAQAQGDRVCNSLSGLPPAASTLMKDLGDVTESQRALLNMLWAVTFMNDITNAPTQDLLLASDLITHGRISQLPNDQWVREIVAWQNYAWATISIMLSDTAIGPKVRDQAADEYTDIPTAEAEKMLCKSMKMRKVGGFANVNIFGFAFVITVSMTIFLVNFFILRFLVFLQTFRKSRTMRLDRWVNDGLFQLQRRAFEADEQGVWVDFEDEIPVTEEQALMSELPKMKRSGTWATMAETIVIGKDEMDEKSVAIYTKPDYTSKDSNSDSSTRSEDIAYVEGRFH